ncbi:type VII toxin-antitoxin system MntA family adenylyltransferase antitoxin [Cognaticolwellia mytili]|uniref:type VII toxin-antitoxin system MntA family adenylyltransferase antitoxin n=1 Tax=Cognaticolwellia mytili TaxID=1888913 RepID=UPI000A16E103|nr:nucleotidyltransferase domain-containing protein [Cognaticolwellia mytili]
MAKSLQNRITHAVVNLIPKVKLIYLFGSHASGTASVGSDLDIAILLDCKLNTVDRWNYASELADNLNQSVDFVDLLSASTVMQNEIIHNGICIYDPQKTADKFSMHIMSMYQHLNEERKDILLQFFAE